MRGAFRPIRTLVVHPEPDSLADSLATVGDIAVGTATTARSAREQLNTGEFNCMVTAFELPDTDGLELLATVRQSHPDLPVILIPGDGSEALASRAISAGVAEYLPKPTTASEFQRLTECITDAVTQAQPHQRLRELTTASNDIHWMFTADWDETQFINEAYADIWGRSPDRLQTDPLDFLNGVHPDDRDRVRTAMEQLSGGESVDFEARVNEAEDYQRWVWIQGEPIRDGTGDIVRVTGFARDITGRVERRQQLEYAEARFRTLAEYFPNGGVHFFDTDLRYQYASGSGFDPIDTSPEDLVGNTIYEVEPYTDAVTETLESLMQGTLDGEYRTTEIPYESRIFEIHSVPVRNDGNTVTGGFFIALDVTEQRESERELAARSAAMEASIDGIAILDADNEYTFLNQAHAAIYGYDDPEAFLGNSWRMCYSDTERERVESEVLPRLSEEGAWRGEVIGKRKDGSTFPQELSLSVTENGRIICVVRDISERKDRTRQLERQNERLEKFTSVVTHDLQSPLNVVAGRLELAEEECDSLHLAKASESARRAMDLLVDLRTLAREGEDVGEVEEVALNVLVEECWDSVETAAATLNTDAERVVYADRSRLRQVFENLFRNAIEHGPAEVTVWIGETDEGFYVADDGPGIPSADRELVFETGYSTSESNTGYGLDIVREIVAAHGWDISVTESAAGGARFDITGMERGS